MRNIFIRGLFIAFAFLGLFKGLEAQCPGIAGFGFFNNPNGTYQFIDSSYTPFLGNITGWQWDFGDNTISNQQHPTHVFNGFGPYNVCLTVTFQVGGMICSDTHCETVVQNGGNPTCNDLDAAFSAVPDSVNVPNPNPLSYTFYDNSTFPGATITNWLWNFGDGTTSTQQNPQHVYQAQGNYNVCLTVVGVTPNGLSCTAQFCDSIANNGGGGQQGCNALVPDFIAFPDTANAGNANIQFWDMTVFVFNGVVSDWNWDFGDGNISNLQNPLHAYNAPGAYNVCLTVTGVFANGVACTATYCSTVTTGGANAPCDVAINHQLTPGGDVTAWITPITGLMPDVVMWSLDGGNTYFATGTQITFIPQPNPAGFIELCAFWYSNTDSLCRGLTCENIYINIVVIPCTASFAASALSANTFEFTNLSLGTFTNTLWSFGDGTTSTDYSPVHAYGAVGNYAVCLSIWDTVANCQSFLCDSLTVTQVDSTCFFTDCVFPGDANHDQFADMYDVLQIGLGSGTTGLPRPNASFAWVGQSSPDWNVQIAGVNAKHADCDGNATIDSSDIMPLIINYNREHDGVNPRGNGPEVFLVFDQNTYTVSQGNIPTIGADIYVGNVQNLATLHGFAFSIEYPAEYVATGTLSVAYDANSWFGHANGNAFGFFQNLPADDHVDVAFTRTSQTNTTGQGKVGRLEFIVADDLVERNGPVVMPFNVTDIRGVNAAGQLVDLSGSNTSITLDIISGVGQVDGSEGFRLYPNPVGDQLNIEMGTIDAQSVEVYDALGQRLMLLQANGNATLQVEAGRLATGLNVVVVRTATGTLTRTVVKR